MSSVNTIRTIVIGSLNTDLVATGIKKFPGPGEYVYGKELRIGPGGKSLEEAAERAVLAGTLQFHKIGIQPVEREELLK